MSAASGCNSGNSNAGFLCADLTPQPVSDDMTYGFAIEVGGDNSASSQSCCKCYELEWLTGAAADLNRKMTVQIMTPGQAAGNITAGDIIILTPGGGTGPLGNTGCRRQFGNNFDWYVIVLLSDQLPKMNFLTFSSSRGPQYGGITARADCEKLPPNLQGGCYWRFNWAGGVINGWDIVYKQVECPYRLQQISGCAAKL